MLIGPPYTPWNPRIVPLVPYYAILAGYIFVLATHLFLRGRKRQQAAPKYLAGSFFSYGAGLVSLLVGLAHTIVQEQFMEVYRFSLHAGYSLLLVGNLFLLLFAREIFEFDQKYFQLFVALFVACLVLVNLPNNWYGVPDDYEETLAPSVRVYSSLAMALSSVLLCGFIIKLGLRLRRKVADDPVGRAGLTFIVLAMGAFILYFVFVVVDAALGAGYSAFIFVAWGCTAAFGILGYLGLIMPQWIQDRILAKHGASRAARTPPAIAPENA